MVKFFWPGLRVFGRALDVSVGFRGVWSVFKFSGSDLVFSVGFRAFWSCFRFSGRALESVWHIYRYHTGIGHFLDYKPVVLVSGIESGIEIL